MARSRLMSVRPKLFTRCEKLIMRACLLVILVALAGCNSSSSPIVIGHVAPLTGPEKDNAEQAMNGIKLAVDDYRDSKPLRPVVVRHADDKGDPDATEGQ